MFWFPSALLEVFTGYIKNISNGIDDDVYKSRDSQPGEMSAAAWGTQRSEYFHLFEKCMNKLNKFKNKSKKKFISVLFI